MQTIFTEQINEIEKAFKKRYDKPLTFEAENMELRNQIRRYCKEKGIC